MSVSGTVSVSDERLFASPSSVCIVPYRFFPNRSRSLNRSSHHVSAAPLQAVWFGGSAYGTFRGARPDHGARVQLEPSASCPAKKIITAPRRRGRGKNEGKRGSPEDSKLNARARGGRRKKKSARGGVDRRRRARGRKASTTCYARPVQAASREPPTKRAGTRLGPLEVPSQGRQCMKETTSWARRVSNVSRSCRATALAR